jgi:hypothetical protein
VHLQQLKAKVTDLGEQAVQAAWSQTGPAMLVWP